MSTERPSKRVRPDSVVRTIEGRFSDSSLTSTPLPSTPVPMAMNSNRENDTPRASNLVLETTPIVDVHHTPHKMSPPVSVPVSASIPFVDSESAQPASSATPKCPSTKTSPSNANCSAFQGANVYMDRPIIADTIHWHENEQSRSQILVSIYSHYL